MTMKEKLKKAERKNLILGGVCLVGAIAVFVFFIASLF